MTKLPFALMLVSVLAACGGGGGGGGGSSSGGGTVVTPTNRAPVLSSVGDLETFEGSASLVTLSASDSDGDTLTFSLSGSDSGAFSIDDESVLKFLEAPDF